MSLDYSDLIDKKFKDLGRGLDYYDCWGLVIEIGKRLGIAIPDYAYVHSREYERIQGIVDGHMDFDIVSKPQAGDIASFKRDKEGNLHFGILLDHHRVIHIGPASGVQVNSLHSQAFKQSIKEFYRCKNL